MTNKDVIIKSEEFLSDAKIINYSTDIKTLVAYFNKTNLAILYTIQNEKINFDFNKYWNALNEYKNGKPIQYFTNTQYFYGYNFYVNNNVLIPRYETEELVDNINTIIDEFEWINKDDLTVIDIGTGSGAIAITLGLKNPQINVYASDISKAALDVTKKNLKLLKCYNVKLLKGNMLEPFLKKNIKADLLVCNPPYIDKNKIISKRVKDYEPHLALFSNENGLFFYKQIFENWKSIMKEKSVLCFEHGYDQKKSLKKIVNTYFKKNKYQFIKDINKKWRMLFIYIL